MKKFLWILAVLLVLPVGIRANVDLGPVATTDYARFPVQCLDSSGIPVQPDSIHVLVWFEGEATANSHSYAMRTTSGGALSSVIDSIQIGSYTHYYFVDQIADIDNNEGNGVYAGNVVLWDAQVPTHNFFQFTIVVDELTDIYDSLLNIGDEVAAGLDTLQSQDDWVAPHATLAEEIMDSVRADTIDVNLVQVVGIDSTADNLTTAFRNANAYGPILTLGRFVIDADNGSAGSFYVGNGDGPGAIIRGCQTAGLWLRGHDGASAFRAEADTGTTGSLGHAWYILQQYSRANDSVAAVKMANLGDGGEVVLLTADNAGDVISISSAAAAGLRIEGQPGVSIRGLEGTQTEAIIIVNDSTAGGLADPAVSILSPADVGLRISGGVHGNAVDLVSTDTGLYIQATDLDILADIRGTITPTDTNSSGEEIAVMPDHFSAADSLGFQGSGSSLTKEAVAAAVRDTAQANPAYFYGPTNVGSGTDTVVIFAVDTSGTDTPIEDVKVTIKNAAGSNVVVQYTDGGGRITAYLDPASYTLLGRKTGFLWPSDALTVSGNNDSVAFKGYDISIGSPGSANTCRVYGYLWTADGEPEEGARVSAYLPGGVTRSDGIIVSPFPLITTSDGDGYFYLDLIPSSSLTGSPAYEITVDRTDGTILRKRFAIPDQTSWQITW